MCATDMFYMSGLRVSIKSHFGIIDSHTQRKRYGPSGPNIIWLKKTTTIIGVICVYPEELSSFGLVLWW